MYLVWEMTCQFWVQWSHFTGLGSSAINLQNSCYVIKPYSPLHTGLLKCDVSGEADTLLTMMRMRMRMRMMMTMLMMMKMMKMMMLKMMIRKIMMGGNEMKTKLK